MLRCVAAARLRWLPCNGFARGLNEPCRTPHCHGGGGGGAAAAAASSWHVHDSSSSGASSWATPNCDMVRLRPFSAAPARCGEEEHLGDGIEDEEDQRQLKQMENRRDVRVARKAFMEYLHVTRGICFNDAEHMSKCAPVFIGKLLEKVKDAAKEPEEREEEAPFRSKVKRREMRDNRVSKALARLFNFHPINEFEPFFESIGIAPGEYEPLLPRHLMFLNDDETLLDNFRVLCNYGIARTKIGRIYRDASEVFSLGEGVLASKLKALEEQGLSKTSVIKLVVSSPVILLRDPNVELKILKWLDDVGIQRDWLGRFLSTKKSYNWRKMVQVPQFFSDLGFTKEGIAKLVRRNPDFLFSGSGKMLFSVVLMMLKAGSGKKEVFELFMNFPNLSVDNFMRNLRGGIFFLAEVGVSEEDIKKFVVSNGSVLGSVQLKKPNSILTHLSVGKKRLCKMIMEDPQRLLKYSLGAKVSRLPKVDLHEASFKEKVKFLQSIGFIEGSEDMKRALKTFRGKGDELQDRYYYLLKTGLDPIDVVNMIKVAPQVLNQKINVLEAKISFFVNDMGFPLSALVNFPAFLSFTVERTKLRFLMYNWLVDKGVVPPQLALSTILACADKRFIKYYVVKHPLGIETWEKFKKEVASTKTTQLVTPDD
ncbi:transcription termination factor MTEF18, mitochondrial-like [Oryza brachyantha]|uniref:transcription termination factor MTEF18, mitochondrial-like n=1 Tax=Oryza brachyantha TaxID=4533 RepID=UPI001ADAAB5C|nr:transcription termination factor MTEF18, mitochondrial-like [Oryza brachyantha]